VRKKSLQDTATLFDTPEFTQNYSSVALVDSNVTDIEIRANQASTSVIPF